MLRSRRRRLTRRTGMLDVINAMVDSISQTDWPGVPSTSPRQSGYRSILASQRRYSILPQNYTVSQKTCHPLVTITSSNLNRFLIFFAAGKACQISNYIVITLSTTYLKCVAALPRETEMLNLLNLVVLHRKMHFFLTDCIFVLCPSILTFVGA